MAWQERRENAGSGFDWLSGLIPNIGVSSNPGPNSAPPPIGGALSQPIPRATNRPDSSAGLLDALVGLLGGGGTEGVLSRPLPSLAGSDIISGLGGVAQTPTPSAPSAPAAPQAGSDVIAGFGGVAQPSRTTPLKMKGLLWQLLGMDPPEWTKAFDETPSEKKAPTPEAPKTPGPIDTSGTGGNIAVPRIPGKTSGGRGDFSVDLGKVPELPPPPPMADAPKMAIPGGPDFSGAKKELEKGRPTGPNTEELSKLNLSQVLSGLASGAGSVSATEPGSFAKALAMSGAGGAQGRSSALAEGMKQQQEFEKQKQAYALARANHEVHMANASAQAEQVRAQVEFNNNKLQWETTHGNALKVYEHQLAVRGETMPQVKYDAQGVHVTRIDPTTRQMSTETYDTKRTVDQAEKLKDLFTSLGASSPVAQNYETRITQQLVAGMDPVAAHAQMKTLAVRQVLANGAGGVVFGDAWPKALKQVEATVDPSGTLKTLKPLEYKTALEQQAANYLLSVSKNDNWLKAAAAHSPAAGVILKVPSATGAPSGE